MVISVRLRGRIQVVIKNQFIISQGKISAMKNESGLEERG
jgi:hypothetical protein